MPPWHDSFPVVQRLQTLGLACMLITLNAHEQGLPTCVPAGNQTFSQVLYGSATVHCYDAPSVEPDSFNGPARLVQLSDSSIGMPSLPGLHVVPQPALTAPY